MRKVVFAFVLSCLFSVSVIASGPAPNAQPAFRDLYWGDPVDKLGPVQLIREIDGVEMYRRQDEDLDLGSLRARNIYYGFWDGRLMTIMFSTTDVRRTYDVLVAKYGEPLMSNPIIKDAGWMTNDTIVSFEEDIVRNRANVILASIKIMEEHEAWRAEQLKKDAASW